MARTAIYLDSNAGAPLHPKVIEALRVFSDQGLIPNASSIHSHGRKAKRWVAEARERIALSFGQETDPEQLVFTSSGTEANQLAIRSVLEPRLARGEPAHWITTPIEHDSTIQMVEWARKRGARVDLLPVDSNGIPDLELLAKLLTPETSLVSMVWVNNETGVIADVKRAAQICETHSVPLHLDASQAWGKLRFHVDKLGAKLVTASAHKIGGLAGVGVLWVGRGITVEGSILGKQEKGRRGGTENVLGIIAAGVAAGELKPAEWAERVQPLRDRLEAEICRRIPGVIVNGGGAKRVANTLNLSFEGVEGDSLVMALDLAGYSVSSGSACSSGVLEPSHVLTALGRTRQQAMAAIRVSLPDAMPWETLEGFVTELEKIVARVRKVEKSF